MLESLSSLSLSIDRSRGTAPCLVCRYIRSPQRTKKVRSSQTAGPSDGNRHIAIEQRCNRNEACARTGQSYGACAGGLTLAPAGRRLRLGQDTPLPTSARAADPEPLNIPPPSPSPSPPPPSASPEQPGYIPIDPFPSPSPSPPRHHLRLRHRQKHTAMSHTTGRQLIATTGSARTWPNTASSRRAAGAWVLT